MTDGPANSRTDAKWPELLSLSAHELRSPLSVVSGFIQMLLKGSAGPLGDQQRRFLEEAEKSCGRLSQLLAEISELSRLESGSAPFNRSTVSVQSILSDAIAALPDLPDRTVAITLNVDSDVSVHGDAVRLKRALSSILVALRRELVTSDQLVVRVEAQQHDGGPGLRIAIGEAARIPELLALEASSLVAFDEWRGGNGLSLPIARRIIDAHGGRVWNPPKVDQSEGEAGAQSEGEASAQSAGKACAVVMLPSAT